MITKKMVSLMIGLTGLLLVFPGCGGLKKPFPEKNLFNLDQVDIRIVRERPDSPPIPLLIKGFEIFPAWDTLSFVYRIGENQYQSDYFNGFIISPATLITDTLKEALLKDPGFISLSAPNPAAPILRLEGTITALYGDYRNKEHPAAILEMRMTLFKYADNIPVLLFNKTYVSRQSIEHPAPFLLVNGWNRALADISRGLYLDMLSACQN